MDKGRKGLINCAKYWKENYPQITVLGIHDTADTSTSCGAEPVILDLPDMKIAVLNYTYGTNGIPLPDDIRYAVDLLDEEQVAADIRRAEELADFHCCMSPLGHRIPVDTRCLPGKVDESFCRKRRGSGTWDAPTCH